MHRGDWEAVARAAEARGRLAEREGLTASSASRDLMRGRACAGATATGTRRPRRCARGPRARRAGGPLRGRLLGALLARRRAARQRDDYAAAETELARALDICERAGLVAQSVEAISARAVTLALAGRDEQAREAAEEAERLAGRLHYPVGKAASLEAAARAPRTPSAADADWPRRATPGTSSGARSTPPAAEYLRGRLLLDADPDAARARADGGRRRRPREYGVEYLAHLARSLHAPSAR